MELSSEAELAACELAVPSQNWSVIPSKLIEQLALAKRVSVLTGAGISAESGVPTFRDAQSGLWARFKPEKWIQFGWATGALATTMLTDYAQPADEDQVWSIWKGNARVQR